MSLMNPTFGFRGLMEEMRHPGTLTHDLAAAVVAGQFAGLVMAVVLMAAFALVFDLSALMPVALIGSVLFGEDALEGVHMPAILAGLVMHQLGPALFWSLVFGFCIYYFKMEGFRMQMALGLGIGVVSQMVDVDLLLPMLYQAMHDDNIWAREMPRMWSWTAHLVYGLCLAAYPFIERRLSRH